MKDQQRVGRIEGPCGGNAALRASCNLFAPFALRWWVEYNFAKGPSSLPKSYIWNDKYRILSQPYIGPEGHERESREFSLDRIPKFERADAAFEPVDQLSYIRAHK